MKTYTLQHASIDAFSLERIQNFFAAFPHRAIDPIRNEDLMQAMATRNAFVFTDCSNKIKGVFNTYLNHKYTQKNKIYAELGSNRLAPKLQGYGLLTLQIYIRILNVAIKRMEKKEDLSHLIIHVDTLASLPQTGPKFKKLGFTEIALTDEQYYPYIKCSYECPDTVYFILDSRQNRKYLSTFATDFRSLLEKSTYRNNNLEGHHILLKHRTTDDTIVIKLDVDLITNSTKSKLITKLAQYENHWMEELYQV